MATIHVDFLLAYPGSPSEFDHVLDCIMSDLGEGDVTAALSDRSASISLPSPGASVSEVAGILNRLKSAIVFLVGEKGPQVEHFRVTGVRISP